jgi:hypothetical protein
MANVQGDINNYDIQVKVCVRNGTPTFELIGAVKNNAQATGSIMSAAPKEITDKIMKSFYPSRDSTAAQGQLPPPPPNPSNQEIKIDGIINRIKGFEGYNKDKYDNKLNEIRSSYIKGTKNYRDYVERELAKVRSKNDFTYTLIPITTNNANSGGRRTKRVTHGNRNKKTQSNRAKHTFSFNLF